MLASAGSAILVAIVLWRQFDPDFDPRELAIAIRDRVRSELEHRAAIFRTLREIDDLPVYEDGPEPGEGEP